MKFCTYCYTLHLDTYEECFLDKTPLFDLNLQHKKLLNSKGEWKVFLQANYTLLQAKEKGLSLANSYNKKTTTIDMDFDFENSFKVGACSKLNHDNWEVFLEYSRLRAKNKKDSYAKTGGFLIPTMVYFKEAETPSTNNHASFCYDRWLLNYDMVDLQVKRPYYVGTNLIFKPHAGLRGGWIKQKNNANYIFTNLTDPASNIKAGSKSKSSSWLIGARCGVDTSWLVNYGFRMFSDIAIAQCYQHFKSFFKQDNYQNTNKLSKNIKEKIGYLTPIIDINSGFGWGSYLDDQNYHFDIAISYEFHYLFCQNMIRSLMDEILRNVDTKAEDLFLHGLNITLRFDF